MLFFLGSYSTGLILQYSKFKRKQADHNGITKLTCVVRATVLDWDNMSRVITQIFGQTFDFLLRLKIG